MSNLSAEAVKSALSSAPVAVTEERRAFGNRRGVPDVVVWLAPEHEAFPERTLPVLIELEGSFSGAAADFEKFANRYGDSEYQHHLLWPAAAENLSPLQQTSTYDIAGIPARRLGQGSAVEEREMFSAISDWFDEFSSTFDRTVSTRQFGETTVLNWELDFRMYGHEFHAAVPYFAHVGEDLQSTVEEYISPPTIPCAVIINDEYGSNVSITTFHNTVIEFPALRAIRFSS